MTTANQKKKKKKETDREREKQRERDKPWLQAGGGRALEQKMLPPFSYWVLVSKILPVVFPTRGEVGWLMCHIHALPGGRSCKPHQW